ncbi:hypothetical protein RRG08_031038 [Elysia crispata]|uniref:Uncharacterized protein n=1 Tax=Elysia crispata TaxID=231223 RepID=A0AAE0ZF48_9GAST|nr:hypothetical protein RRG08_031038 [Elysia crispata]
MSMPASYKGGNPEADLSPALSPERYHLSRAVVLVVSRERLLAPTRLLYLSIKGENLRWLPALRNRPLKGIYDEEVGDDDDDDDDDDDGVGGDDDDDGGGGGGGGGGGDDDDDDDDEEEEEEEEDEDGGGDDDKDGGGGGGGGGSRQADLSPTLALTRVQHSHNNATRRPINPYVPTLD